MTDPLRTLLAAWSWQPGSILGLVLLAGTYGWLARRYPPSLGQGMLFTSGLLLLSLTLLSPLEVLGDRYLLSAHMLQQLLLVLAVPPLLLRSLPEAAVRDLPRCRLLARLERTLGRPLPLVVLLCVILLAWHVPALYEQALAQAPLHAIQRLALFGLATLYWWPAVHAAGASARLSHPERIAYLIAGNIPNVVLGAILTLASAPLYPTYASAVDPLGLFPLTRESWGLTPLVDQQLGGLLVWVPGGLLILLAIGFTFLDWEAQAAMRAHQPELDPTGSRGAR